MSNKAYLGDSVYYMYDGFNAVLTTENGICVQDEIVLEPEVVTALLEQLAKNFDIDKMVSILEKAR